jgi:hypothetical protein
MGGGVEVLLLLLLRASAAKIPTAAGWRRRERATEGEEEEGAHEQTNTISLGPQMRGVLEHCNTYSRTYKKAFPARLGTRIRAVLQ